MTDSAVAAEWDERYTTYADRMPDDAPSAVLIEVAGFLTPGTALDVGCGIGANAIWLAAHGWDTTALDVSQVALDRAAARGRRAGVDVRWECGRLEDVAVAPSDFVVAHYPALRHSPGQDAERALLAAVAPGGALLVVHHANVELELAKAHGFDPSDYVSHDDVVGVLGDGWDVTVERDRPRDVPAGLDGQHTHDDVIVARRNR
ncbi:methyltransferase domain-containing protein [Mycolicibacterium sp. BiH015]|uniref:class I SAM-dependent methyltransferase n=1 Tax=Mycolicibacterium sp. BiH015 TaxID=3018808 RepID=UPI0022E3BFC3|nr:class I SAM-dependent methyltransferase [Mycolicibacterium sp. BiH015]MDA2889700.1 methyltransferase domain-containing protein [Mycolicibacterium sp. BiH015]